MITSGIQLPGVGTGRVLQPEARTGPLDLVREESAWRGTREEAAPEPIEEETAWHLRRVSHYGEESVHGQYHARRPELREEAPSGRLTAIQALPPVQWTETVSKPQLLTHAKDEQLIFNHDYYRHINSDLRTTLSPSRATPASVTEPKRGHHTRYLRATDEDHPLYYPSADGMHMDCLELEVRWSGPRNEQQTAATMSVYALFLDSTGLVVGTVSENTRWFLTEERYAAGLHCLYRYNEHGGYATVFIHLSELPQEVSNVYLLATCEKLATVTSVFTTVSSRHSMYDTSLEAQFVLDNVGGRDLQDGADPSEPTKLALARLRRYKARWSVGALNAVVPGDGVTDPLLSWVYFDRRSGRDAREATTEAMKVGITGKHFREKLLRLPPNPKINFDDLAALFNAKDTNLSGSLSLNEYVSLLEDVYWKIGENPPPAEVLHRLAERELRAMDRNKNGKLSLDEFVALFHKSELCGIITRAAIRAGYEPQVYLTGLSDK